MTTIILAAILFVLGVIALFTSPKEVKRKVSVTRKREVDRLLEPDWDDTEKYLQN